MFNDMTLNGLVPSNQTSVRLSELFPDHPMPNANYTCISVRAVNMAGAGPPSMPGMYSFDNVHTYVHMYIEYHMYIHSVDT